MVDTAQQGEQLDNEAGMMYGEYLKIENIFKAELRFVFIGWIRPKKENSLTIRLG